MKYNNYINTVKSHYDNSKQFYITAQYYGDNINDIEGDYIIDAVYYLNADKLPVAEGLNKVRDIMPHTDFEVLYHSVMQYNIKEIYFDDYSVDDAVIIGIITNDYNAYDYNADDKYYIDITLFCYNK